MYAFLYAFVRGGLHKTARLYGMYCTDLYTTLIEDESSSELTTSVPVFGCLLSVFYLSVQASSFFLLV